MAGPSVVLVPPNRRTCSPGICTPAATDRAAQELITISRPVSGGGGNGAQSPTGRDPGSSPRSGLLARVTVIPGPVMPGLSVLTVNMHNQWFRTSSGGECQMRCVCGKYNGTKIQGKVEIRKTGRIISRGRKAAASTVLAATITPGSA